MRQNVLLSYSDNQQLVHEISDRSFVLSGLIVNRQFFFYWTFAAIPQRLKNLNVPCVHLRYLRGIYVITLLMNDAVVKRLGVFYLI